MCDQSQSGGWLVGVGNLPSWFALVAYVSGVEKGRETRAQDVFSPVPILLLLLLSFLFHALHLFQHLTFDKTPPLCLTWRSVSTLRLRASPPSQPRPVRPYRVCQLVESVTLALCTSLLLLPLLPISPSSPSLPSLVPTSFPPAPLHFSIVNTNTNANAYHSAASSHSPPRRSSSPSTTRACAASSRPTS